MRQFKATARGAFRLGKAPIRSRGAKQRLKWMDYSREHRGNASLTCWYFGISRQTFSRWKRRYRPQQPQSLEEGSRRVYRQRAVYMELGPGRSSATAVGGTSSVGQGYARLPAPRAGLGRFHLHGRAHPHPAESPRRSPRAALERDLRPLAAAATPLCGAQAQGVSSPSPRRPGPTRHPGRPSSPRRDPQARHRSGRP